MKFLSNLFCALDIHDWIRKPYSKNEKIWANFCLTCHKEVELENMEPKINNKNIEGEKHD
jgi:hypothetical protein